MITAHHLEVRAGARLLMDDVSFRVAAGDKVGLVGRNGAGKTTLTKILAGEALPASGSVTRAGSVGYLPQDPRTGDPEVLALRPHPGRARPRRRRTTPARVRGRDGLRRPGRPGPRDAPLREGRRRAARRWRLLRRGRGPADLLQPQHRGPDPRAAAAHPLRRPAPPRRAGPDPVLRGRDAAARRAHQPPRRRLHRLAARLPQVPQGRADRDQPRRGAARRLRQQGPAPRREPRRDRPLQHGLVDVPRPARDRREAPQARADERREQGEDAHRPGEQDARQGHQGAGRPVDAQARREDDGGPRGRASRRPGRQDQVPGPRSLRQDPAHRGRAVEVLRVAGGLHRRRPGDRQGQPGGHPRPQRRGQDDAAADPGRRRPAGHRRGQARATASSSATTPRSTRPWTPT